MVTVELGRVDPLSYEIVVATPTGKKAFNVRDYGWQIRVNSMITGNSVGVIGQFGYSRLQPTLDDSLIWVTKWAVEEYSGG